MSAIVAKVQNGRLEWRALREAQPARALSYEARQWLESLDERAPTHG
jgi:hypothetical protein